MRAFSTIEILLALAILTSTLVAVALVALGTPFMLANMKLEHEAYGRASMQLERVEHLARLDYSRIAPVASSTQHGFTTSLSIEPLDDEASARVYSNVSWTDSQGENRFASLETTVTDPTAIDAPCDPLIIGDWTRPRVVATYQLSAGSLLPAGTPIDTYSVSDISVLGSTLIASVSATGQATSSTLFFFNVADSHHTPLPFGIGFDNASTSRTGFSAVTTGAGYVFAANGFGSASAATCADNVSCAQLQIFEVPETGAPQRIGTLAFNKNAFPHAVTATGASAGARAVFYYHGFLYLGLEKTSGGQEFVIVDVHDAAHPRFLSGVPIGRSVNHILVRGSYAYVATDDPARELTIVDIHDPQHPVVAGVWNAPGSIGFGLGSAITAHGTIIRFGRTYVNNAPELLSLAADDLSMVHPLAAKDIGTALSPESVRGLLTRDFLTYVLTTTSLQFFDTSTPTAFTPYAMSLALPSGTQGTALACRGNMIYIGLTRTSDGTGFIQALTSS
ncbi:MAG: hypothetical protein V4480_04225 [Patescibacteria group bacterium]